MLKAAERKRLRDRIAVRYFLQSPMIRRCRNGRDTPFQRRPRSGHSCAPFSGRPSTPQWRASQQTPRHERTASDRYHRRLRRIEVGLQTVKRGLHVERHPERDRAGLKSHVWIEEDERLRNEPVRRKSALAMPGAIEIGDGRACMFRFCKDNTLELVIAKSGFKPPFRFGTLSVRRGRVPADVSRMIAAEIGFNSGVSLEDRTQNRATLRDRQRPFRSPSRISKWGRKPKQLRPADLEADGVKLAPPLAVMRAMWPRLS